MAVFRGAPSCVLTSLQRISEIGLSSDGNAHQHHEAILIAGLITPNCKTFKEFSTCRERRQAIAISRRLCYSGELIKLARGQ